MPGKHIEMIYGDMFIEQHKLFMPSVEKVQ